MSKSKFAQNLVQALERKDQSITDEELEEFLRLNYDEDGDWDWDYDTFSQFASDVCQEGFWGAVAGWDLHYPGEYDEEEEDD